ncbi:branched-chain amino acid ABC transporter permease [Haladaptatus caseinilyticus]|uniref:branched-chain amino acid ABC transporter permease n=1 Tax=Haladaptatus caseinilyticus TaxID=2993314 RepID=UPI00224A5CA0|nr:branched-chain amino acid ABC transporter permease [Haladaptatus caseinilyticus]
MGLQSIRDAISASTATKLLTAVGAAVLCLVAVNPFIEIASESFLFYLMFWVAMTLSVNLVFGYTGYIPFGYFAFYGVGAYGAAIAYIKLGVPMLVAVAFGGICAVILGVIFLPMFRVEGIYFAIATFAAAWALKIGITMTPEELTGGATGLYVADAYDPFMTYYAMFAVLVGVVVTTVWLDYSRLGTMLRAMRDDPTAAAMSGINNAKIRSYAWLLSTFFPGLIGGIDTWQTTVVTPEGGFDVLLSIKPILYAIFGGVGTVLGPILGSVSLYLIDDIVWSVLPMGSYLVTGLILMLVVLVFPRGLIGEFEFREGLLETKASPQFMDFLPNRGEK